MRWFPKNRFPNSFINMKQAIINIRNTVLIYAVVYSGVLLLGVTGIVYIIVDSIKRRTL